MISGLRTMFHIRYEDRRKVWIMGTVFFLAGIAEMVNYTSFMAIFNSRVGTQYLPLMYLFEALLLPIEGWLLSFYAQRISKPKFMTSMYILFVGIGLINGAVLLIFQSTGVQWLSFYILLFITSNFVVRQQTLLMWSTVFDLCPTQQAKRLMPVFVISAIIGGIAAGVLSNTLGPLWGPDVLYILGAVILCLGLPNFLKALKQYLIPLTISGQNEAEQAGASSTYYFKEIVKSPFLLAVIGIMTLMPAIYFLMEYQYFTSAQAVFKNESELTSFYGLMVIILFCGALLLQLFASKLIEWLGASNTIFAISAIFLGSFAFVSFFIDESIALIAASIGYSLLYLLLYYFAEPSYQFYFKMLPMQHRDGFRYTAQGIAASAGILLGSAASMLHSELEWSLFMQAVVGTGLALALFVIAWLGRHLYIKELVRYLKISSSTAQDVLSEFMESMKHDRVRHTLIEQLNHPDVMIQRITLELFVSNPDPAVSSSLFQYADRCTPHLRELAFSAIHPSGWELLSRERQEQLMKDEDEHVRAVVYRQLFSIESLLSFHEQWIEAARSDTSPVVQVEALKVMDESDVLGADLRRLLGEGGDAALLACEVIGMRKLKDYMFDVMMCLLSPLPAVKHAAVRTMGKIGGSEAATSLTEMLIGADKELRMAIEQAMIDIGDEALPELSRFITSPNEEIWRTTVTVVNAIGSEKEIRELLVPSCIARLAELQANRDVIACIEQSGHADWAELAWMRMEELRQSRLDTIWAVMVRFGDERAIPRIRMAIESADEEVRDHGLEILSEGLGHPRLAAALLHFYQDRHIAVKGSYDQDQNSQAQETAAAIEAGNTDPWLQAIAVKADVMEGETALVENWDYLKALDKIVFLKQVPLFEAIPI